jgi:hypothetical protein
MNIVCRTDVISSLTAFIMQIVHFPLLKNILKNIELTSFQPIKTLVTPNPAFRP